MPTTVEPHFCKDCKFANFPTAFNAMFLCLRAPQDEMSPEYVHYLITGKAAETPAPVAFETCESERSSDDPACCGPNARFFETNHQENL